MMHRGLFLLSLALCVIGSQSRHRAIFRRDSGGGDTTVAQISTEKDVTSKPSTIAETPATANTSSTVTETSSTVTETISTVTGTGSTSTVTGASSTVTETIPTVTGASSTWTETTPEPEVTAETSPDTEFPTTTGSTPWMTTWMTTLDPYDEFDYDNVSSFASRVLDVSSEYGEMWSADAILGAPDVYPRYGDFPGAWQQLSDSSKAEEWIIVQVEEYLYIDGVVVYETYNSGRVTNIAISSPFGCWFTAWSRRKPEFLDYGRKFEPEFQNYPDFMANTVKITTKPSAMGWVNLDSVEIYGVVFSYDIEFPYKKTSRAKATSRTKARSMAKATSRAKARSMAKSTSRAKARSMAKKTKSL